MPMKFLLISLASGLVLFHFVVLLAVLFASRKAAPRFEPDARTTELESRREEEMALVA